MLVQFILKNVLSFKDETILDMTTVSEEKELQSNLIDYKGKEKFLKVAAIYGANASGKSNLHLAFYYFKEIVKESFNNIDKEELTAIDKYYVPFGFEENRENSEFEIILLIDDFEYKYGYEYNEEYIVCEWMYRKSRKTNEIVTVFERTRNDIRFGEVVGQECELYKKQVPADALVLSFFNKLNIKTTIFFLVYQSIMEIGVITNPELKNQFILKKRLMEMIDSDKKVLLEFLRAIDTGIYNIRYETRNKEINFYTTHVGKNGKEYEINYLCESGGTLQSIGIFIYIKVALYNRTCLFIDELNLKLHPLLLKFMIDLFYNSDSTAQLIYTTHDTTLLDKKYFRKDQIWFVQKDFYGYSELIALSDFKVRSDLSFEKDYLAGVYGGIPFLKEFDKEEGK